MAHFGELRIVFLCGTFYCTGHCVFVYKIKIKNENMSVQSGISIEIDLLDDSVEE